MGRGLPSLWPLCHWGGGAGAALFVPDGLGVAVKVPIFLSTTLMLLPLLHLLLAESVFPVCSLSGMCCNICILYCFLLASP